MEKGRIAKDAAFSMRDARWLGRRSYQLQLEWHEHP
jgi:hypothetical protein